MNERRLEGTRRGMQQRSPRRQPGRPSGQLAGGSGRPTRAGAAPSARYTAEDVIRLRGSVQEEHTLARLGAERLWKLLHERGLRRTRWAR